MKIGNVKIEGKLVLAPMAAINCPAFRLMCKKHGAGLIFSSMIHCNSLTHLFKNDKKRVFESFIDFDDKERPLAAQIVGSDIKLMGEAARILSEYAEIIDLNFGCPESNILAGKGGAFFVKHPEQMDKVLNSVMDSTNKPVTAKIRSGWDEKSINALEVCKKLEDFGLSAVTVHGRTKKQGYSGKANWDVIKEVKEKIDIPVIGNGDVFKPGTAKAMIDYTNCDLVMIGRGAIGNPFIFSMTNNLLEKGGNCAEPTKEEKKEEFLKFVKIYGEQKRQKFPELRDHAIWFVKGIEGARKIKPEIVKTKDKEELIRLIKSI